MMTMGYSLNKASEKRTQDTPLVSVSDRGLRFNTLASRLLALEFGETKMSIQFHGPGEISLGLDPKNGFRVYEYRITKNKKLYTYGVLYIKNRALKAFRSSLKTDESIIKMEIGEFKNGVWPLVHIKK